MFELSQPSEALHFICRHINGLRSRWKSFLQWARYVTLMPRFKETGGEIFLDTGINFYKPQNIQIGDGTFIGENVVLNAF